MIRRAAVTWPIDPIHGVARLYKVMNPTRTTAEAHHMSSLSAASVNHHDGIGITLLGRNHVLHEHLALWDRSVRHRLPPNTDEEAALIRQAHAGKLRVAVRVGTRDYGGRSS